MKFDADWQLFLESLWTYQYVKHDTPLNEQLSKAVHDMSTGITDIAIKVYMFAQERAIDTGEERVTEEVIRSIPSTRLQLSEPVLSARRAGKSGALPHVKDIHLTRLEAFNHPSKGGDDISSPGQPPNDVSSAARAPQIEGSILNIIAYAKEHNSPQTGVACH
jgi:hypothetical protein